ncbi:hypothetical protein [Cecembia rubra]|uniref:Uncharacterized protein n=1 Tax=Cecembia rubra TaxID=1485585 RepID=A0A2P8E211_9BACT|nr:hypothetical protein [Cecembia rubra]PSL03503.1 hypothetical protein CLV48_107221 [Cecembia rubra]
MIRYTKKYTQLIWLIPIGLLIFLFGYKKASVVPSAEEVPQEYVLDFLLEGNERFAADEPLHADQPFEKAAMVPESGTIALLQTYTGTCA